MENFKHTPGQWRLGNRNNIVVDAEIKGYSYAICYLPNTGHLKKIPESAEANAKLIAAAPELLETLQRALNDFKNQTWTEETYNIINKTINKATK